MKNSFLILILLFSLNSFSQNSAPGLDDVIGQGYDIFGQYASPSSIKNNPIFDFSKCKNKKTINGYSVPSIVRFKQSPDHKINQISGSSIREYSENLSKSINISGNAQFFSGSVSSNFKSSNSTDQQHYYQTLMDVNSLWVISLDNRYLDTLRQYLDDNFKSDLENSNVTPEIFFNNYGTHYISSALIGGRIDYSLNTTISSNESATDVQNYAKAKYGVISGDASLTTYSNSSQFDSNTSENSSAIGGNTLLMNNIKSHDQYVTWAEGIKSQPVLCGFSQESLKPIWELSKNDSRKQELKNYYENVILKNHPLPEVKSTTVKFELDIVDVYIITNCENAFDITGEFELSVQINSDIIPTQPKVVDCKANSHHYQNLPYQFELPNQEGSVVEIKISLRENDLAGTSDNLLPIISIKKYYPFEDPIFNGTVQKVPVSAPSNVVKDFCKAEISYLIKKL